MHKNLASFNNKYLLKDYCTASFVHVIIKVENLGGLRLIWSFQIEPVMTGIQRGPGNPHDCDRGFFFHVQLTVWRHRQELPSKVRPRREEGPESVKSQRQDICQPWEFRHSASEEEISPLIKVSKKKKKLRLRRILKMFTHCARIKKIGSWVIHKRIRESYGGFLVRLLIWLLFWFFSFYGFTFPWVRVSFCSLDCS